MSEEHDLGPEAVPGGVKVNLYELTAKPDDYAKICGCNQGTGQGESCVLFAPVTDADGNVAGYALRDSKFPTRESLRFTAHELQEFVSSPDVQAALKSV